MSHWLYVTLSCHNWKRNDFHYSGAYLFTSFVHCINVYWSVIHGIKRKPHLSVAWNRYHFVAIAILHQPRPTDSADINTRLQLSDTSSIPPMHGGFLLIYDWHLEPLLLAWINFKKYIDQNNGLVLFPTLINDYIYHNVWSKTTYPFETSMVQPLKFGNSWVISSHTLLGMSLHSSTTWL